MNDVEHLLQEKYNGVQNENFASDRKRLAQGEPLGYVIGHMPFLGATIFVSPHTLLPRVETEFWVEKVIKEILQKGDREISCLDIFSGSGCIGVALLSHIVKSHVDFADLDDETFSSVRKSIAHAEIEPERARTILSNVFQNIHRTYDYIFANPPYIDQKKVEHVQKSVLKWEPESALFAENEGLYYIHKLLVESDQCLEPSGTLFVECDSWQKERIEAFARSLNKEIVFHKDQYDAWRMFSYTQTKTPIGA